MKLFISIFLVFLAQFSYAKLPTFFNDPLLNHKCTADIICKALSVDDQHPAFFRGEYEKDGLFHCYEVQFQNPAIDFKNYRNAFLKIKSNSMADLREQVQDLLNNEIISIKQSDSGYEIIMKGYETRKLLRFNVNCIYTRLRYKTDPSFGKTKDESYAIAQAVINTVVTGKLNGELPLVQKKDEYADSEPFDGTLNFSVDYDFVMAQILKTILGDQDTKALLKEGKLMLTKKSADVDGVEYVLSYFPALVPSVVLRLKFVNSENHDVLQHILPAAENVPNPGTPFDYEMAAYLFFKRFSMSSRFLDSKYSVAVIYPYYYIGERNWAVSIAETLDSLGVDNFVFSQENFIVPTSILSEESTTILNYLLTKVCELYKTTISISLSHVLSPPLVNIAKRLVAVTLYEEYLMGELNKFPQLVKTLPAYDGYLYAKLDRTILSDYLVGINRSDAKIITFYPSTVASDRLAKGFKKIFYCGQNWDQKRGSTKFTTLFKLLEDKQIVDVYGPDWGWKHLSSAYKGLLPFGKGVVEDALRDYGLVLCFHSEGHIKEGIPTARFFEIAAVGALAICDEHPFFMEHFKDAALFVNTKVAPDEIYQQIMIHYEWVMANPQAALEMAKRAHAIFKDNFALPTYLNKVLAEFS